MSEKFHHNWGRTSFPIYYENIIPKEKNNRNKIMDLDDIYRLLSLPFE